MYDPPRRAACNIVERSLRSAKLKNNRSGEVRMCKPTQQTAPIDVTVTRCEMIVKLALIVAVVHYQRCPASFCRTFGGPHLGERGGLRCRALAGRRR